MSWSLVVPVKRLQVAKTRLELLPPDRADLALAMAADVVTAALACSAVGRVLVVSDDERAREALSALGADLVNDEPDNGLNPALGHGVDVVRRGAPRDSVAIVSSDLPAATASELTAVLSAAQGYERSYLADKTGVGTTVLSAQPGVPLTPCFGERSAAAHRAAGHRELSVAATGLRCDVDTLEDLAAVLRAAGPEAAPRTRAQTLRLRLLEL